MGVLGGPSRRKLRGLVAPLSEADHHVLTGLGFPKGRVELVVVGPSGVYVIEAKGWRGKARAAAGSRLVCGGLSRGSTLRRVREQATLVRRQMAASGVAFPVTGVIALTNARTGGGPIDLRSVLIVEADDLARFIARRQRRLDTVKVLSIRDELAPLADSAGGP